MEILRLFKLTFGEQTVVFQVLKQCDLSIEGCWVVRTSVSEENRSKCRLSAETCPQNRRITIHEVVNMLAISLWSVQSIWKESLICFWLPPNMSAACRWGAEGEAWQHVSGLSLDASRDPEFPCDIFHFLKLKMALKRRRFIDNTMIKQHCGMHLLSFRPCTSQNAVNNTAVKSPKDSTLEQTTLN